MEIATLLRGRTEVVLPTDIILCIYHQLVKLKKPLTDALKHDIENYHFYLINLIRHYLSIFSADPEHDDYYLFWLENDLCGILNDDIPLMLGLSDNVIIELNLNTENKKQDMLQTLRKQVNTNSVMTQVNLLWNLMTPEKKMLMYETYKDF